MDAELIKIIKSLKSPYVKLEPNYIAGTDLSLSLYNIIYINSPITFIGTVQELEGKKKPDWINTRYDFLDMSMKRNFDTYTDIVSRNQPIYHEDNIRETNLAYNDIIGMKKADGAKLIKLYDKYMMYLVSGMSSINKPDKVSIDVYPYDNISFIVKFTIHKKGYDIHQFMRCLDIVHQDYHTY